MNKVLKDKARDLIYIYQKFNYKYRQVSQTKKMYKRVMGKEVDLENPKSLSEKLTYLNLYTDNHLKTRLTDKYEMKGYIDNLGYGEFLVKTIGIYNNANEINFEKLPNAFVLKGTHGCGYNIICRDKSKLDIISARKQLDKWMKENFAYRNIERHYEPISPRIICEEYIGGLDLPIDYKIYCLNGKAVLTQCCSGREEQLKLTYYDLDWNQLDYSSRECDQNFCLEKPKSYNEMVEIAQEIAKPFDYVRVDFYEVDGKPLIGELTFTPACGRLSYLSNEADEYLGSLLKI